MSPPDLLAAVTEGSTLRVIMGIPVLTNSMLCKTVARTWRERLLSWPWRPWVKLKTVPDPDLYLVNPGDPFGVGVMRKTYIGHPLTVEALQAALRGAPRGER